MAIHAQYQAGTIRVTRTRWPPIVSLPPLLVVEEVDSAVETWRRRLSIRVAFQRVATPIASP